MRNVTWRTKPPIGGLRTIAKQHNKQPMLCAIPKRGDFCANVTQRTKLFAQ